MTAGRGHTSIATIAAGVGITLALALGTPEKCDADASSAEAKLELTLKEAVELALRHNRTLIDARYKRQTQKFALDVNEDRYRPRASVGSSIRNDRLRGTSSELSVGPSLRIPTGGELRLSWSRPLSDRDRGPEGWTLGFQQPLLRGFGIDVETAPTRIARINERRNILSLHDTVVRTVTAVIREYRALIRARSAVQISREALARAVQQLETNRALISAGRMAVNEIIATEGEVANRRLALADAENAVVAANAALVSTLDIDTKTRIEAVEDLPAVAEQNPDVESNIATALANRRDYRRALMDREIAKINMRVAKDARRWDLTLQGTVSGSRGGEPGRTLGISLAIPFGDRTPKLRALQARSTLRSAEIAIVELDQSIRIAVGQATQRVQGAFHRVALTRKSRELAQQNVNIEQQKLERGLTSTSQLSRIEGDLVRAQTDELDSVIAYLNAITALDQAMGMTAKTWNINIDALDTEPTDTASLEAQSAAQDTHRPQPRVAGIANEPDARRSMEGGQRPARTTQALMLSIQDFEKVKDPAP